MSAPDYSDADNAETNDGRVISWGLTDVAFELRTANLVAFLAYAVDHKANEITITTLTKMVMERLELKGGDT